MKARHHMMKKHGGPVSGDHNPPVTDAYAGGNSEVAKAAKEKKHGGGLKAEGHKAKRRADHQKRKAGGRVGADSHPFTTAANTTEPKGTKEVRMD